jgi:hypothetical protein
MNKGVTVRQAAQVCRNFTEAGVMVHAYLMYGFPTQTAQETIDSLETVRQFFQEGLIQSAFWHRFTATVHSDVGRHPEKYCCTIPRHPAGGFAQNDLVHEDPSGCDHDSFSPGLTKAVYNFMHGIGMEFPIPEWFTFPVPRVSLRKDFVGKALEERPGPDEKKMLAGKLLWLGNVPGQAGYGGVEEKKGSKAKIKMRLSTRAEQFTLSLEAGQAQWLAGELAQAVPRSKGGQVTLDDWKRSYEEKVLEPSFRSLLRSPQWKLLREKGLLLL